MFPTPPPLPKQLELRRVTVCACVEGGPVHAMGMCRACYGWWRRHGEEIVTRRLREQTSR